RPRQCRAGCGHDHSGARRGAQSADRWLARPGDPLSRAIYYSLEFRALRGRAVAQLRLASQAGLREMGQLRAARRTYRGGSGVMLDSDTATWGIAAIATFGVIVRPWRLPEFIWAVTGAVLLVVFKLLPWPEALAAAGKGTDV